MSIDVASTPIRNASVLPFYRFLAKHPRDPVSAFEEVGRQAGGRLVRLNMGPFRPYLVTHPDHVQHVLRANQPNYVREGMFWDPLIPLLGEGILSDGETWQESRRVLQPLFTAKYIESLADRMADILTEQIDATVRPGEPFDVVNGISAIVHPTIVRLFFGDRISKDDIDRLIPAYEVSVTATWPRLLMPFVPASVPLPGDRAFRRSIETINRVVYPRVHEARRTAGEGRDVVSAICRARAEDHGEEGDRRIRDDMVSMHGASTETSATALTWVWVALDQHPDLAEKIYAELDEVIGSEPVRPSHLPDLRYLKMFLSELVRLYPPGWILPRKAVKDDEIDGVRIKAGSTVMISPYLTHRLGAFWDRPAEFDPERFGPDQDRRHRWAYFPFGGGPHKCLGQHLFMMEAQLLMASLLSRFRPVLSASRPVRPRLASSLRPNQKVELTLVERARA
ncbi:cytochrome P450 [Microbispora cellulosiformans]|uniref:Cytochrome P450 n=1 Tax=Microbispora cellulosiformans TaxID=2614688 RepID=A0A5J5JT34_9ACTN|nr:cytochrome P450 [Microbispora cellulosiformans]KAA9374442.1 cytochrome P450 [Microbispora cellulosiformans]